MGAVFNIEGSFYRFFIAIDRPCIVSGTRVELKWIYFSTQTLLFIRKEKTLQLSLSCLIFQNFSLACYLASAV